MTRAEQIISFLQLRTFLKRTILFCARNIWNQQQTESRDVFLYWKWVYAREVCFRAIGYQVVLIKTTQLRTELFCLTPLFLCTAELTVIIVTLTVVSFFISVDILAARYGQQEANRSDWGASFSFLWEVRTEKHSTWLWSHIIHWQRIESQQRDTSCFAFSSLFLW